MIDKADVFEHRGAVLAAEADFFLQPPPDVKHAITAMNDFGANFRARAAWFRQVDAVEELHTNMIFPRPSLETLHDGFIATTHASTRQIASGIINQHLLDTAGILPPVATRLAESQIQTSGRCSQAEPYFYGALRQLQGSEAEHQVLTIYHDESGVPLAIQKEKSVRTAILVEPTEVDGCAIPIGTIVKIGHEDEGMGEATADMLVPGSDLSWRLEARQVSADNWSLAPMRASAWSYTDEADRALFATTRRSWQLPGDLPAFDEARANMITTTTIHDFRDVARERLEQLGV